MEEEGEKAGRKGSKFHINIGTCVWGAPTMPIADGGEGPGSSYFSGSGEPAWAPGSGVRFQLYASPLLMPT